ncbi:hypothetical protein D3C76_358080 [compost metagenome]
MVDSLTIALRFTDGDVQLIDATIRRSRVEVIRSMRTRARCGTQYKFRVPL